MPRPPKKKATSTPAPKWKPSSTNSTDIFRKYFQQATPRVLAEKLKKCRLISRLDSYRRVNRVTLEENPILDYQPSPPKSESPRRTSAWSSAASLHRNPCTADHFHW